MKYLFFDIECSNCFQGIGKMCEFGYVLTDENLVIMKCGDIPISPGKGRGNRFNLVGRKHEKDLELAYDYEYYFQQPEFPHFYKTIRDLVEDPGTICFAYSMDNDIPHLHHSCTRYRLKPFDYICYDVQKLTADYLEKKGQMSLRDACLNIVGRNSLIKMQVHFPQHDAEMEKMVFEAICVLTKKKPNELLKESKNASTNSIEFMKRMEEKALRKKQKTKGHDKYRALLASDEDLANSDNFGNRFNVSGLIKSNPEKLNKVIEIVKERNGLFSDHLDLTDYFIVLDDSNKEMIINVLKRPFAGEMLTFDEFITKFKKSEDLQ